MPSSSTTPPTNALYDGCAYHYLPWTEIKPYIQITSFWEKVVYRLEASNHISHLCRLMVNKKTTKLIIDS